MERVAEGGGREDVGDENGARGVTESNFKRKLNVGEVFPSLLFISSPLLVKEKK